LRLRHLVNTLLREVQTEITHHQYSPTFGGLVFFFTPNPGFSKSHHLLHILLPLIDFLRKRFV